MTGAKSSGRIGAIVLAAGASTRLGFPKQLLIHQGQPLVRRAAVAAFDAGASRVVVVLGARAETIAPALDGLPSVMIVVNPDWEKGLSSSLSVGLAAVFADPSCDGALVTLADQPFVDEGALRRLIKAFDAKHRIVASGYDDTIGVPAVFGREFRGDLMGLTGDAGAGSWIRSRRHEVTRVPLHSALDIDKSSDVARLTK